MLCVKDKSERNSFQFICGTTVVTLLFPYEDNVRIRRRKSEGIFGEILL